MYKSKAHRNNQNACIYILCNVCTNYRDHVATKLYNIANNYEDNSYSNICKRLFDDKKARRECNVKSTDQNSSKNPRKPCYNCFYSLLSFCFFEQFLYSYPFFFDTPSIRNLILLNHEMNVWTLFMNYVTLLYNEEGSSYIPNNSTSTFALIRKFVNFFHAFLSRKIGAQEFV